MFIQLPCSSGFPREQQLCSECHVRREHRVEVHKSFHRCFILVAAEGSDTRDASHRDMTPLGSFHRAREGIMWFTPGGEADVVSNSWRAHKNVRLTNEGHFWDADSTGTS